MNLRNPWALIPGWDAVGGLPSNSTMPGPSWGIPIKYCWARKAYAKKKDSVCSGCYCAKGRQSFPASQKAQQRRLDAYLKDPCAWTDNMVTLLDALTPMTPLFMRWFDSGDFYDYSMFIRIMDVCRRTPHYLHWISTQDRPIRDRMITDKQHIPGNATIRFTNHLMIGHLQVVPLGPHYPGLTYSAVEPKKGFLDGLPTTCSKHLQTPSNCADCRRCWDRGQTHISYRKH